MAQVKHYDAYNQETNRNTPQDNVIVSDRTLHEIYMPAFEAAVQSRPRSASVMCGYSLVNGSFDCQSRYLLYRCPQAAVGVPRICHLGLRRHSRTFRRRRRARTWSSRSTTYFGATAAAAVQNGTIPRAVLNTMVAADPHRDVPLQPDQPASHRLHLGHRHHTGPRGARPRRWRRTPRTMLLRTRATTLPLPRRNGGTVAVIGPSASVAPTDAGGGSAYVVPSQTVTPLQGHPDQPSGRAPTSSTSRDCRPTTHCPPIPSDGTEPRPTRRRRYGGTYTGTLTAPATGTVRARVLKPCTCYTPTYLSLDGKQLLDDPGTPPVASTRWR